MTPSPRHENSVDRIKTLVRQNGHEVWENTDEGGSGGYRLPMMLCDDGISRSFVIDCLVRLKTGAMMAFEVDFNHPTTAVKREMLRRVGITPVTVPPASVDLWVKEPELLDGEIAYSLKRCKPIPS